MPAVFDIVCCCDVPQNESVSPSADHVEENPPSIPPGLGMLWFYSRTPLKMLYLVVKSVLNCIRPMGMI